MRAALCISLAYLLGSIPSAYLVSKARGYDIRTLGDRNVGAANILRCFGVVPAAITLGADVLKGTASVLFARLLGVHEAVVLASGVAAIAGHNWPITLGFRGGRGVATTLGVLLPVLTAPAGPARSGPGASTSNGTSPQSTRPTCPARQFCYTRTKGASIGWILSSLSDWVVATEHWKIPTSRLHATRLRVWSCT